MRPAILWISGAFLIWLGLVFWGVHAGLRWDANGYTSPVAHLFGAGGLLTIVAGALLWRKA